MEELSMHVLDIVENSTRAGAALIEIVIAEDHAADRLTIEIIDDGEGMGEDILKNALDPFYTTKTVRRIGLGLPLLAHAAETAGGSFSIESEKGSGTRVTAHFSLSHIDRQPLGNMANTMATLLAGYPDVDFLYTHRAGEREFVLDTREIKEELEDVPINTPEVLRFIRTTVVEGLKEIGAAE